MPCYRKKQSKLERAEAQAKRKKEEQMQKKVVNNLVARLSKFVGPACKSPNNIRFSSSGVPHGLLLGTPTFSSIGSECKETRKLLSALEGGSSSAKKSFREVFALPPPYAPLSVRGHLTRC